MKVLGIDPGGRTTGLVVRSGRDLLDHRLVNSKGIALDDYLGAVVQAAEDLDRDHAADVIAVEVLVAPTPHMGLPSVRGLLDTAHVIGALLHAYRGCARQVRPGGHGKVPDLPRGRVLDAWMAEHYPAELIGPREVGGAYTGILRHARSAWDVAGARETVQQRFGITS